MLGKFTRAGVAVVVASFALFALTGCTFGAPHMHPTTPIPIVADPAAATVVFVRPSYLGAAITSVIATAQGRFLGESQAHCYFVAKLPPGEHMLISWSESTPALRATLAPGAIYYVEVAPKMGLGSARLQLLVLSPRRENWAKLRQWMAESSPIEADEPSGNAFLQERRDDFAERVKAGMESYQGYSPEDRDARTIRAEDGVQQPIGGGAPVALPLGAPPPILPPPGPPARPSTEAPSATGLDTVILKSGARYRGTVMEDEPTRISMKLPDGTTKILKRADVNRVDYAK